MERLKAAANKDFLTTSISLQFRNQRLNKRDLAMVTGVTMANTARLND